MRQDEIRELPPLVGLASAWNWFLTDHQNGGHADNCGPNEPYPGCHCGLVNLRNVIESLTKTEP